MSEFIFVAESKDGVMKSSSLIDLLGMVEKRDADKLEEKGTAGVRIEECAEDKVKEKGEI